MRRSNRSGPGKPAEAAKPGEAGAIAAGLCNSRRLVVAAVVLAVFSTVLGPAALVSAIEDSGRGALRTAIDGDVPGEGVFEDNELGVHQGAIDGLAQLGVFERTECAEGLFCPGKPVLRGEMAVWLARILVQLEIAQELPESQESRFADVPSGAWWVPHVELLADLGVTVGCATGPARFCPEDSVTRAQMASFLGRAFELVPPEDGESQFVDIDGNVHAGNIVALAASGITKGCAVDPARFCPDQVTARAQMASFLLRAYTRAGGSCPSEQTASGGGGGGGGGGGLFIPPTTSRPPPRPERGAPASLSVDPTDRKLTVSWAPPAEAGLEVVGYRLRWKGPGQNYSDTERWDSTDALSYEIDGLVNGASYSVQVAAGFRGVGLGPWAEDSGVPRTLPGRPQPARVVSGNRALTVSWLAPSDTGGAPITGYRVRWLNGGAVQGVEDAATTTHRIADLVNGVSYEVQVAAVNAAGQSLWSREVPGEPLGPPGVPGTPTAMSFDRSVVVEWSPPGDDGGLDITGYKVQWRTDRFGSSTRQHAVSDDVFRYRIPNLVNGTTYLVRVLAVNPLGDGAGSQELPVVPATSPGPPARPQVERGHQQVRVAWQAPDDGGSDITGYVVQWSDDEFDQSVEERRVGASVLEYLVKPLTNGTEHFVRVLAVNAIGDGAPSSVASATPATTPGVPVVSADRGDRSVVASWTAPDDGGSDIESYRVVWSIDDQREETDPKATVPGGELSRRNSGLVNGTEYWVWVQAVNGVGVGPWSSPASATPAPAVGSPRGVQLVAAPGSLTVSWQEPAGNGGPPITGYKVQWRSESQEYRSTREERVEPTSRSYEIESLTNGTEYFVRVLAVNAIGDGAPSPVASATPATTPGVPVVSADRGDRSVVASWTAPDDGGSDIESYRVVWSIDDQREETDPKATVPGGESSRRIGGLVNGTEYWVWVQAVNGVGAGPWSSPASATAATVPGQPRGVTFERAHESVAVAWQPPDGDGGSDITGYVVQWSDDEFDQSVEEGRVGPGVSEYLVDRLTNGREYSLRVQAVNGVGGGPWALSGPVTPATVPGVPGNAMLEVRDAALVASWTALDDGGSDIESYWVVWSIDDQREETDPKATVPGGESSRRIGGLVNGTEYWVWVQAVNGVGAGPWSSPQSAAPARPPTAPQNVETEPDDGAATVSWEEPTTVGGADVTSYLVQWSIDDQREDTDPAATVGGDVFSYRITGLVNGTEYKVWVSAENAGGVGPPGETVAQPRTVPGPPASLALAAMAGTLLASWDAPDDDGGADVTSYLVQWNIEGQGSETGGQETISEQRIQISDLMFGVTYTVSVSAVNPAGTGAAVSASLLVDSAPGAPRSGSVVVRNGVLEVYWEAPAAAGATAITGYRVAWKAPGESYDSSDCSFRRIEVSAGAPYGVIGPLVNSTTYSIQVVAVNESGPGDPLEFTGTPLAVPGRPEGLGAFPVDGGLLIDWDQPWDGGSPITGYRVQWKGPGQMYNDSDRSVLVSSSTLSHRISGLTNGTEVDVRVTAVNANGASEDSVTGTPADAPGPPTAFTARSLGVAGFSSYTIRLSWSAPAEVGGSRATKYLVETRRPWELKYRPLPRVDGGTLSSFTLDFLEECFVFGDLWEPCAGREYLFRVRAINSDGIIGPPAEASATL